MLAVHGINPYAAALAGSPDIVLNQFPNYLPLLYVVMAPLGLLPFAAAKIVWMVVNLGLAGGSAVLSARWLRMSSTATVGLVAVMFIATPTRIAIGNGQQALLVLFMATLALQVVRTSLAGVLLAGVLIKYSFGPLALVEIVRGRWRAVVVAVAILGVGLIVLAAVTQTSPVVMAVQPLLVSRTVMGPGVADLMTIMDTLVGRPGSLLGYAVAPVGCVLMLALTYRAIRRGDGLMALACGSLISLLCFKHLNYDLVFLLPVLGVAWRSRGWPRAVVFGVVGYFWFVARIADAAGLVLDGPRFVLLSFALLALALYATTQCTLGGARCSAVGSRRPLTTTVTPARAEPPGEG